MHNNTQEILEQISAAMDDEDVLPAEFFNLESENYKPAQALWNSKIIIQNTLLHQEQKYTLSNDINNILLKLENEQPIYVNKTIEINNNVSDTIQRLKKWLNIALPIGITAAFMGASIITHNAFNIKDISSAQYFSAHQTNDVHAYSLVSLANLDEDEYIDSNIVVK